MAPADLDNRDFDHPALNYRPPRSVRVLHAVVRLVLSVGVVVGGWSLIWGAVATLGKSEVANWIDGLETQGIEITYSEQVLSGWPSRIDLTYIQPKASFSQAGTRTQWRGEQLNISMKVWQPWLFDVDASGRFIVQSDGSSGKGVLNGTSERLSMQLNPGDLWPDAARLQLKGLKLSGTLAGRPMLASAANVTLDLKTNLAATKAKSAITAKLRSKNLVLPWSNNAALSNRVGLAEIDFKITGPVGPGSGLEGIKRWQSEDGKIMVDNLVLHGQPLGLSGAGAIKLDENLQPVGQMTAKITGLLPTINRFRDVGLIRDRDAVVAKMTLAALSQKTADGRSVLNLAVKVSERTLYLGPVAVAEIPELDLSALE